MYFTKGRVLKYVRGGKVAIKGRNRDSSCIYTSFYRKGIQKQEKLILVGQIECFSSSNRVAESQSIKASQERQGSLQGLVRGMCRFSGSLFKEILHVGLRLGEVLFLTMVKIIRFRSRVRGQRRRSVNSSMLAVQVMRAWPNGTRQAQFLDFFQKYIKFFFVGLGVLAQTAKTW